MELRLQELPSPEVNNSAGRLLSLLQAIPTGRSYYDAIVGLYGASPGVPGTGTELKGRAYIDFMRRVGHVYDELLQDLKSSPNIAPEETRAAFMEGLSGLVEYVFPNSPQNSAPELKYPEVAMLKAIGGMLEKEPKADNSDTEAVREAIENLRRLLEHSDLSKSARIAMLELVRLGRNALDHYAIYGARGFREAFKRMLAELMEVYAKQGKEAKETVWWGAAWDLLVKVDFIASKLSSYQPLVEKAGTLFLGSQNINPNGD